MSEGKWFNNFENVQVEKPKEYCEFGLVVVRHIEVKGASLTECEKEGTNWKKLLEDQEKNFLEIGGPSLCYVSDEIIDFQDYIDRTICTNISDNFEMKNQNGETVNGGEYVDEIADAANLPFQDETFGAVFARNFRIESSTRKKPKPLAGEFDAENSEYIRKAIKESWRVLDRDGLVIWLNLESTDFKSLLNSGFELVFYQKKEFKRGAVRYQAVFRKKDEKKYE